MKHFNKAIQEAKRKGLTGIVTLYGELQPGQQGLDVIDYNMDTGKVVIYHPYVSGIFDSLKNWGHK